MEDSCESQHEQERGSLAADLKAPDQQGLARGESEPLRSCYFFETTRRTGFSPSVSSFHSQPTMAQI